MDFNQHFYLHFTAFLREGIIPLVDKHLKHFDLQQNRVPSTDLQYLLTLQRAHFKQVAVFSGQVMHFRMLENKRLFSTAAH